MAEDKLSDEHIDFHAAKPGDVCNHDGDIRGADEMVGYAIIRTGVTFVTEAQAEFAKRYGWAICGRDGDLVKVQRR